MKIYTIENVYPLDEIFSLFISSLDNDYKIDENSYMNDLNLLIIGINETNHSIIIRGSIDKSKNRFCFSILALQTREILEYLNLTEHKINLTKSLGNHLYKIIKNYEKSQKNFIFANIKMEKEEGRILQIELIESEKEILLKILHSIREKYNYYDYLDKYPFSLSDIDGTWETWFNAYDHYINLIEDKFQKSNDDSLKTLKNFDFALDNAYSQRIADLIIMKEEETIVSPLKNLTRVIKTLHEKYQDQLNEEKKRKIHNLKITFIFAHKKKEQLKLIQMLKISGEVKLFIKTLHRKSLKRYNQISPQIVFISLFGFEKRVGNYLKDNLYGNLSESQLIITVPPIDEKLWNNYFVFNSKEENEYMKSQSVANLAKFNKIRSNNPTNLIDVRRMESEYNDIVESKKVSVHNFQQLNEWEEILSLDKCSELLDVKVSRERILKIIN